MLYPTLSQPIIFLALFAAGLGCGFLFDGANIICALCNKNKIVKQVFYFISAIASSSIFYFVNLSLNYGIVRTFAVATFILAIILQRATLGKLFAKINKKCYNKLNGKRKKAKDS